MAAVVDDPPSAPASNPAIVCGRADDDTDPRWPQASQSASSWRDPTPHQIRWITVDSSVRLEVVDWGGSGPPSLARVLPNRACVRRIRSEADESVPCIRHYTARNRCVRQAPDRVYRAAVGKRCVEVLDSVNLQNLLVGTSCAGQILTLFASQHSDRLNGLVYIDGASNPTVPAHDPPMPDPTTLPVRSSHLHLTTPHSRHFETLGNAIRGSASRAELRQQFAANPDGSVGRSLMSPEIRRAITVDARIKPDYSRIRVPVLAIYQADGPFEKVAGRYTIRNEQERAALHQEYAATRAITVDGRTIFAVPFRRLESLNCRPPIRSCFCRMRRTCSERYDHSRPH